MDNIGTPHRGSNALPSNTAASRAPQGSRQRIGARVRVWPGGSRVEVREAPLTMAHPAGKRTGRRPQDSRGGGKRGKTAGLSRHARKRLLDMLGTLQRDARPVVVGLTLPDVFSDGAGTIKRGLGKLRERLRYGYPDLGAVWALDVEPRRSGASEGLEAPHAHALLYARPGTPALDLEEVRAYLGSAWAECVGGDEAHRQQGVYAEWPESLERSRLYLIARKKRLTETRRAAILASYPAGLGSCWGVWNRDALPTVEPVEVEVTEAEAAELRAAVEASASARSREAGHGGWIDPRWRSLSDPRPERWARRVRRRRSRRQRAENRPSCLHSVSTRDGAGLETKRKRLRIGVSASPEPLSVRGAKRIRTAGLCSAIAALYQLSYSPRPSG